MAIIRPIRVLSGVDRDNFKYPLALSSRARQSEIMNSDPISTFLSAFHDRSAEKPNAREALFLGALWHAGLEADWLHTLCCIQSFKPDHDRLAKAGFETMAECHPDRRFDLCLVRNTKHKQESMGLIAQGLLHLRPSGTLYVAGAKDEGIESVEKRLRAAFEGVRTDAKRHSRTIFLQRPHGPLPETVADWHRKAQPDRNPAGFLTIPGIFSHGGIDRGSQLLVDHLPRDLHGIAADFGAGWGFLSCALASSHPNLDRIDLFEADARALSCARINLSGLRPEWQDRLSFNWCDIADANRPAKTYDLIVMNPPFHHGKETRTSLGSAFISAAAKALKPRGKLYLVANRTLPYERALQSGFCQQSRLADMEGFKVIEAVRQ
jgi:16S rRNA (guanine1207-N2)-methyltransferase